MEPKDTVWLLDDHTRGKHLVLKKYLDAWFPILGFTRGRILFVDGFAGPGEYQGGELGSPLIALDSFVGHRSRDSIGAEVYFVFIEAEPERADHLRALLEKRKPYPPNCQVEVKWAQFDTTMNAALDELDREGAQLAPSFVMIDPFGVSGVPLSVVQRIMANPSCEVYFSFMIEAISRFRAQPEFESHLDDLFGCPDWRDGIDMAEGDERRQFFYSLYERQLRSVGAKQVIRFELFEGNRLIYAIFFASQNSTGAGRMKEAIWKVAGDGSFQFRGARQTNQLLMNLEQPIDFRPLREALREEFASAGWISVRAVEQFVESDRTDYYVSQLRKGALSPLEDAGLLEVRVEGKRRSKSYPKDKCTLRFR